MRTFILLSLLPFLSQASEAPLPREVLRVIPKRFNLRGVETSDARRELRELIANCGAGVVEGAADSAGMPLRNQCSFQVRMDDLFFRPLSQKTGLLHDRRWPYQDNVTWYEPHEGAAVPEAFDLRELMTHGQPVIKNQNCGDCWAWATHHGLEITRAVNDAVALDLSVQTVLSCSHEGSCGGGYMSAVDFLVHGLPLETGFPYSGSDKSCKFSSSEISSGWDGKIIAAPYIGDSLSHSLAKRGRDGRFREGAKVQKMMAAMYEWKSPLVVTVDAYDITGPDVYNSCSAINSEGNHMVAIVGWEMWNNKRVAHVWNSWGPGHGDKGVSRIVWECGDGRLNRGLGYEAKIVQYKSPCTPPDAAQTYMHEILLGQQVQIGAQQSSGTSCTWTPTTGLANSNSCVTTASPSKSTEYHLKADNACGTSSSMALVYVWGSRGRDTIVTPFGEVDSPNAEP